MLKSTELYEVHKRLDTITAIDSLVRWSTTEELSGHRLEGDITLSNGQSGSHAVNLRINASEHPEFIDAMRHFLLAKKDSLVGELRKFGIEYVDPCSLGR